MKKLGSILLPGETRSERRERAEVDTLWTRYLTEPAVRKMADEIHTRRMMSPPACAQCIKIAVERLGKKL